MNQSPRFVLITGASTGIGKSCALHLDRIGFHVFAGVRKTRDADSLREMASSRLLPVFLDVTDQDTISATLQKVMEISEESGLAGLVNNAGIVIPCPSAFLPLEYWRNIFEINVLGAVAVTQAFLPLLVKGRGRVVNMSSISGRIAYPLMGPYAASKFALEAISDALRLELLPWGIKLSIIEPGPIKTPIWDKGFENQTSFQKLIPDWAQKKYKIPIEKFLAHARQSAKNAAPPEVVAYAVQHALTAKKPKTRYPIGRGVRFYTTFFRIMPDWIRDRIIAKASGLG